MKNFFYLAVFIFGSIFGSFFYTLIVRVVKFYQENAVKKTWHEFCKIFYFPSHCEQCQQKIKPYYLIPILGYFLTKGTCSNCQQKISIFYPLSELFWGILALYILFVYGFAWNSLCLFFLFSILIVIGIIDFQIKKIPNFLIVAFFLFSLYPVILQQNISSNLYGAAFFFAIFLLILLIFPGGMGAGDLKLATVLGFFLGLEFSFVAFEISIISGALFGVTYVLLSHKGWRLKIPFAPFLILGFFIANKWGAKIILLYYKLL